MGVIQLRIATITVTVELGHAEMDFLYGNHWEVVSFFAIYFPLVC